MGAAAMLDLDSDMVRLSGAGRGAAPGGAAHRVLALDLTNAAAIVPAVQQLRADVGSIYGLCHAAGIV